MSKLRKFRWWHADSNKSEQPAADAESDMNSSLAAKGDISFDSSSRFKSLHLGGNRSNGGVIVDNRQDVGAKLASAYDTSGSSTPVNGAVSPILLLEGGTGTVRRIGSPLVKRSAAPTLPSNPAPVENGVATFASRLPTSGIPTSYRHGAGGGIPASPLRPMSPPTAHAALLVPVQEGSVANSSHQKSLLSRCAPSSPSSSVAGSVVSSTSKQRLGDLLNKIDTISCKLRSQGDLTHARDFLSDLMFLAAQCASRNKHDLPIRRRVVTRLITSGILDIIIKVFWFLHSVNYLDVVCDWSDSSSNCIDNRNGVRQKYNELSYNDHATDKEIVQCVQAVIACLGTATEKSVSLSEACIKRGLLQELLLDLADTRMNCTDAKPQFKILVVRSFLSILTNISRNFTDSREAFRLVGALSSLQMHSRSTLVSIRACCITLLAYISTETENQLINSTDKNVAMVVKMLDNCMSSTGGMSQQFGCSTLDALHGLNKLATFDINKEKIVESGALPLYIKLMGLSCLPPASSSLQIGPNIKADEQLLAVKGVWLLSHNSTCRIALYNNDALVKAVRKLSTEGSSNEIKVASRGCLYTLFGNRVVDLPRSVIDNAQLSMDIRYDVVVSYEWSARVQVARICDRLAAYGCSVWLNLDHRGGAPLDRTKELIEKASVVLVCLSQKYKNCPSCRAECSLSKNNNMVPIRIQQHYSADGWLLHFIGEHYVYDFSCDSFVSVTFPAFIKDVTSCFPSSSSHKSHDDQTAKKIDSAKLPCAIPYKSNGSAHHSPISVIDQSKSGCRDIRLDKWSPRDVSDWLLNNGLEQVKDKFKHINGVLLVEILRLQSTAPETFYTILRRDLDLDFVHLLRFTAALERIQTGK